MIIVSQVLWRGVCCLRGGIARVKGSQAAAVLHLLVCEWNLLVVALVYVYFPAILYTLWMFGLLTVGCAACVSQLGALPS